MKTRRVAPRQPGLAIPERQAAPQKPLVEPGLADVRGRLTRSGSSPSLLKRVLRDVQKSGRRGAFAIDAAARSIAGLFPVSRPRKEQGESYVIAFVGPTGAGKTTTMAKLGRRLSEAGRKVVFISLDPVGATALETVGGVEADVDRTEIPIVSVRDGRELTRTLREHMNADLVLIDTPGFSPREEQYIERLGKDLARARRMSDWDSYLVLPANASRSSLALSARSFAALKPTGCVLTKLDETDQPAGALEESVRSRLPIAFLTDGQDVRDHLVRPRAGHFADLLLRGKLV